MSDGDLGRDLGLDQFPGGREGVPELALGEPLRDWLDDAVEQGLPELVVCLLDDVGPVTGLREAVVDLAVHVGAHEGDDEMFVRLEGLHDELALSRRSEGLPGCVHPDLVTDLLSDLEVRHGGQGQLPVGRVVSHRPVVGSLLPQARDGFTVVLADGQEAVVSEVREEVF
jgi:hypothetical protein